MFKIRWSTIVCVISAGLVAEQFASAKDEHHKHEHKGSVAQPQIHKPIERPNIQPKVDLPKVEHKIQLPQNNQPRIEHKIQIPQDNRRLQVDMPKVEHKVHLMQNNQNNQKQPKIDLPKIEHKNQNNQPRVEPKIQLPQNNLNNSQPKFEPKIQLPQNQNNQPKFDASKLPQLQNNQNNNQGPKHENRTDHKPKINLPSNTIPGNAGGAGTGNSSPGGTGVQPKIVLPPQGDSGRGTKLPQFDPNKLNNSTKNQPLDSKLPLDPKHQLGNGRGDNPLGSGNKGNLNPGLGNNLNLNNKPGDTGHKFNREHLPMKLDQPITGVQKQTVPLHVPKVDNKLLLNPKDPNPGPKNDQFQTLLHSKDHQQLRQNLEHLKHSPDFGKNPQLAHLNLDKISGLHQDRLQNGQAFQHWKQTNVGHQLSLDRQFQLQQHGDVTRQMNFSNIVINNGGWQHRHHGAVAAAFTAGSFSVWYAGGGCYPTHCWYPKWSPWVSWCWWDTCVPFYDPRPYYCRPIIYQPCQPWVFYQYPIWQPLPVVTCGTWVDVEPIVIPAGMDLQLLAVRFVDNGHPEQNLGPRYRVWVRNNSQIQITSPFSVLALAGNDLTPTADLPQAGVVIPSMDIGEVKPVDIRLPLQANRIGTTPEGHRVPFNYLHVLVDSHQQINETNEANNGSVVARTDILPVDPASFSTDLTAAAPGTTLTIAGEGFGPEPGRVLVSVNGQQTEALIQGWYDLGIRFTVPEYNLTGAVDADILVVRGDGAVSNPLDLDLAPATMLGQAQDFPAAPVPDSPQ